MQASQSAVASATLSTFNLPFVIRGLLSNSLSSAEAHSQALSLCQEARSILTMVLTPPKTLKFSAPTKTSNRLSQQRLPSSRPLNLSFP